MSTLRRHVFFAVVIFFTAIQQASAIGPVAEFIVREVGARILSECIDKATGKPDINLIQQRLAILESNVAHRTEMQGAIEALKLKLNDRVTREELQGHLSGLKNNLLTIEARLENLEMDRELHEVRLTDLEEKTQNSKNSYHFNVRAAKFLNEGNPTRALANYAVALSIDSNNTQAMLARARYYLMSGSVEIANLDYEAAMRVKNSNNSAYVGAATTYYVMKQYDDAIRVASEAVKKNIHDKDLYFIRGCAYYYNNDNVNAEKDYLKCVAIDSSYAMAHNGLGFIYETKGDLVKAVNCFSKAIEIYDAPMFYLNRGSIRRKLGIHFSALFDINKSLSHVVLKASDEQKHGLGEIAAQYYLRSRKGLFTTDGYVKPYEERALITYALNMQDKAFEDLTLAIDKGSNTGDVYAARGHISLLKGNSKDAFKDLRKAHDYGVEEKALYTMMHDIAVASFEEDNAHHLTYAERAIEYAEKNTGIHNDGIAEMHWIKFLSFDKRGEGRKAFEALKAALKLNANIESRLKFGYISITNNTNIDIDFCPDYWIAADGSKVDLNNGWFKTTDMWTIKAGKSVFMLNDGNHVRSSKMCAWIQKSDNTKAGKTYEWSLDNDWIKAGKFEQELVIENYMLPQ